MASEEIAPPPGLKLRGRDVEDMDIIASCLQDALVPLRDIRWLKREKRLVLVANRFMWECVGAGAGPADPSSPVQPQAEEGDASFEDAEARRPHWRTNATLIFDKIKSVKSSGIDTGTRDQFLNLLTIASEPKRITLVFSDEGRLRLEVSEIRCHLSDVGEPWPSWSLPQHEDGEPAL
ncbi:MAG TPA: DUF2948 family protein [Kiloniellales bacterium]|nr:DUF2948 family protein [Kiloniellales bacterium]